MNITQIIQEAVASVHHIGMNAIHRRNHLQQIIDQQPDEQVILQRLRIQLIYLNHLKANCATFAQMGQELLNKHRLDINIPPFDQTGFPGQLAIYNLSDLDVSTKRKEASDELKCKKNTLPQHKNLDQFILNCHQIYADDVILITNRMKHFLNQAETITNTTTDVTDKSIALDLSIILNQVLANLRDAQQCLGTDRMRIEYHLRHTEIMSFAEQRQIRERYLNLPYLPEIGAGDKLRCIDPDRVTNPKVLIRPTYEDLLAQTATIKSTATQPPSVQPYLSKRQSLKTSRKIR